MRFQRPLLAATVAASALLSGCIVAPVAPGPGGAVVAGPPVYAPMPAPVYETAPPPPVAGYIWFGGFWAPRSGHWHWNPGYWGPRGGRHHHRGWR